MRDWHFIIVKDRETVPSLICVLTKRIIVYRDRCFAGSRTGGNQPKGVINDCLKQ